MSADNIATLSSQCDAVIARYSLLRHSFYVAWSNGTLPVRALKEYAREYGSFIAAIGQGWETVGEPSIAQIEAGHAQVWERTFAASLETSVAAPTVKEVADLVAVSAELFAERSTALGALYAFEAQQPLTAQSKLKGLQEQYRQLPAVCGEYFRLHAEDYDEPALLAREMDGLDPADQTRALAACERMCQSLYDALTGIHGPWVGPSCGPM